MREQVQFAADRPLETVFFGGGTPSLMLAESLEKILACADETFGLVSGAEITLESNPGAFELAKFKDLKSAGVNRLSLGVQSFEDQKLRSLGRVHNAREAKEAALGVREIFDNFNLDLMFGLPNQSLEDLKQELAFIAQIDPPHLSYYQLTLEPNTYFAKYPPEGIPNEDTLEDMTELIAQYTTDLALEHYEVSAYAKSGHWCRHNLNYWGFGDYLAIGPGAHGKYSHDKEIHRFYNYRDPARWLLCQNRGESFVSYTEKVPSEAIPFEFMLNVLRLRDGVPRDYWDQRAFVSWSEVEPVWRVLEKDGLVEDPKKRICCTEKGWRYLNEVLEAFL